jgi:uncharacterized protein (DUF2267 family)
VERLTDVTLEVLGERLYRTERDSLGAQLAGPLKSSLNAREEPGPTRRNVDRFSAEEFYNRISARAEVGFPEVRRNVPHILGVLSRAVTPQVLSEVLNDVSDDFKKLIGG